MKTLSHINYDPAYEEMVRLKQENDALRSERDSLRVSLPDQPAVGASCSLTSAALLFSLHPLTVCRATPRTGPRSTAGGKLA